MQHPFKEGDQVIFFQDTLTGKGIGMVKEKKDHLQNGTILTVIEDQAVICDEPFVRCVAEGEAYNWFYYRGDLKYADSRTEDEIYLDNLLKGANLHDTAVSNRRRGHLLPGYEDIRYVHR